MYSYNNNLEEQIAAARDKSHDKKRCQKKYEKLKEECESYILNLRPPENEWFTLGSKTEFLGFKKTYYFYVDYGYSPIYRRSVKFAFSEVRFFLHIEREGIHAKNHIHLENIAEIIAKKKAEEALSPVISIAR